MESHSMNPKNILTLIGAVLGLQSIGIFIGAEAITTQAFASMSPDATGIQIGTTMHQVLAVMNLMVAVIVLSARSLDSAAASKVLMGTSIGISIVLAHGIYNLIATPTKPPLPVLAIMTLLVLLGFITARKG